MGAERMLPMSENVHSGHRSRMRERFRNSSLASMQEHEQLELLLFYAIPRCNTNETAHRLLQVFGSIAALIDAPVEEIEQVPGVGNGAGTFFRLLHELLPIYAKERSKEKGIINSPIDAAKILIHLYTYIESEALTLILLNARRQVIHAGMLPSDRIDTVDTDLRRIAHTALNYDACGVILGHNHPSEQIDPSVSDLQATVRAADSLSVLGIDLLDHIIVSQNDFYSFAEHGHIRQAFSSSRNPRIPQKYDYTTF
jgi:DNA repair protein RadC